MKVTVLGSSGSMGSPRNPASGYLIEPSLGDAPGVRKAPGLLMDLGPGTLARLQEIADPSQCHVMFSHLHADHCLDFPSLMVWRRFHPKRAATRIHDLLAPKAAPVFLGRLSADNQPDEVDDCSDTFTFRAWVDGEAVELDGGLRVTPRAVVHPVEAYCLRIEEPATGETVVYSGDTAWTDALVEAAEDANLLLCESNWGSSCENKAPDMHLCGREAGKVARLAGVKKLVIVHVPPWEDPDDAVAAAREEFDGPVEFGAPGTVYLPGCGHR